MDQILCTIIGVNTILLFIPSLRRRSGLGFWAQMGYVRVTEPKSFFFKFLYIDNFDELDEQTFKMSKF